MDIRVHFPDGTTADLPPTTRAVSYGDGGTAILTANEGSAVVLRVDYADGTVESCTHHPQPLRAWIGNRARVETADGWRPCVVEGWERYAGRLEVQAEATEAALVERVAFCLGAIVCGPQTVEDLIVGWKEAIGLGVKEILRVQVDAERERCRGIAESCLEWTTVGAARWIADEIGGGGK